MIYFQDLTPWGGERIDGIRYGEDIADAEMATAGLYRAKPYDAIPDGKKSGDGVEWDGSAVRFVLEDIPWPVLSQRQFWKVLALAGMHADVMAAVDALPLEDQIEAKQALSYRHDHWLIQATRPAFGLDDAQFRDLWFWGASL